jgi:DNA-nicking Smr family endonuclease
MSARGPGGRRGLSKDERVLWSTFTRSIAPLRETSPAGADETAEVAVPPAKPKPVAKSAPAASNQPPAPPLTPLGRRLRGRVARGKQAIDARLDLHGLTQSEAHARLLRFLRDAQARDARLVLVITGKGRRGDGERGVLKRQVPQWLGMPEFRSLIVGFEDAGVRHGGEGALYVRMRRLRSGQEA